MSGKAVTGGEPQARRPAVDTVAAGRGASAEIGRHRTRHHAPGAARVTYLDSVSANRYAESADAPTVYVCVTCRPPGEPDSPVRPGETLAAATLRAAAGTEVQVRPLRCLGNCSRGASAAMRANGSWTYVFGGLDVTSADALIEGARMLARAADGILPWRGRPAPLKRGLVARVPPIGFEEVAE